MKTSRFCHSPVLVGRGVVMQKVGHFLIRLLLLKISLETQTAGMGSPFDSIQLGQVTLKIFLT